MYSIFQRLLNERGITPYRLAKDTGISPSTLSDWKNNKSVPKNDKMQKIADYLNVSVDYLLGKTDIPKVKNIVVTDKNGNQMALDDETLEYIDSLRTRPEMRVLFSVTNKATKEDIIKAVKIIEALKNESE